ncbi:MAG: hypothetical protein AB1597_02590 [Chloroflexota bacterium]
MRMAGMSLVSVDDLSDGQIEEIFALADQMQGDRVKTTCRGKIMASLFFEPSTRTRLSFETAMYRLGGNVISAVEVKSTSLAKGESIADMARVIGKYADIIVMRHPWEGAARIAAEYAGIPVINAGDGGHEHPTQTLCDLYTIRKSRKTIKGLKIALCGDLKYGRTVHSLIYALARLGASAIIFSPGAGFQMPEHVIRKLTTEYGGVLKKVDARDLPTLVPVLSQNGSAAGAALDAIYITPDRSHQLTLIPDINLRVDLSSGVDALYMTRLQKERLSESAKEEPSRAYPVIDRRLLKGKEFQNTLIMHPLPRVDELAFEMDSDPRAMYFEQAAYGVPVRMALISLLLGRYKPKGDAGELKQPTHYVYSSAAGSRCENPACVTVHEARYVTPKFAVLSVKPPILRCLYCDHEKTPKYIGNLESHIYHTPEDPSLPRIKPENCLFFDTDEQAQKLEFRASLEGQPRSRSASAIDARDEARQSETTV